MASAIALVANVASALLGRSVNLDQAQPPVVVTTVSMTIGAACLLVNGALVEGRPHVTMQAALLIAWLAVVKAAFAFTLWNLSLRRLSAIESAGISNMMLVQIAVLAWNLPRRSPGRARDGRHRRRVGRRAAHPEPHREAATEYGRSK